MDPIKETLSSTPLFKGLADEHLEEIVKITHLHRLKKGEMIFMEGDDGVGFYIVSAGKVKIFKVSIEGKEQILHIFGPGEPFGEVPVFAGQTFPASAQAIEKTRLLFIPRASFIDLITKNPSLALNMLAVLSMRLRQFTVQIENLSLKEVPGRLAGYLIYLAKEQKSESKVALAISKGQLASLLGTIPETLSRILSKMVGRNLIEVDGKSIKILDYTRLEELAEHGKIQDI